jgi:hypothetical protein
MKKEENRPSRMLYSAESGEVQDRVVSECLGHHSMQASKYSCTGLEPGVTDLVWVRRSRMDALRQHDMDGLSSGKSLPSRNA